MAGPFKTENQIGIFSRITENPNEEFDLYFERSPGKDPLEMSLIDEELFKSIEYTVTIVKSLKHTKKETKRVYFNKLLSLARVGFLGVSPQPKLAQTSLDLVKQEILLIEGHRIKNRYMKLLGIGALVSIVACWIVYGVFSSITNITPLIGYFSVWTGSMVGLWISFGARKLTFQLDDLSVLEKDNMNIYIRLPYIGLCAIIFFLLLNSEIFSFEIGETSFEAITGRTEFQLLIGVIAGLFESKLGSSIYEKIQGLTIK
ncbi:hypothetical protein DFR62_0786 [Planococcus citreus]|uniref:Uncharacterized protein n=2 Tax=Planococcus citreus TaxID=1373 RepID=A0A497YMC0_9BACL|nr:hypothetical protein DFR62_0786 [Planococcus citreus]